jgi:hypothetical protein
MSPLTPTRTTLPWLAIICLLAAGCRMPFGQAAPAIEFQLVPEAAEGGPEQLASIGGRVTGARAGQQIVLFARSGVWWVQPFGNKPFTEIGADATWKNTTHLGTEYAALLVEPGYRPPQRLDALPAPGGQVVAVAIVKGRGNLQPPPVKTLHFSGYDWAIRQVTSDRGGTPQIYDPANAWTDAQGLLHLRIARRAGRWTCAEVVLTRSLGYGTYAMTVRDSTHLEPPVVLSMFTWDDAAAADNHREVDVELTQWGNPTSDNAQYTVQPYYVPANVARFAAPAGLMTHLFRWEPGRLSARSVRGGDASTRSRPVAEHLFTSGVPSPGGEAVRINLYIFGSAPTPLQNETEVVIEKFQYLP